MSKNRANKFREPFRINVKRTKEFLEFFMGRRSLKIMKGENDLRSPLIFDETPKDDLSEANSTSM
jgi:hypothetical protein